MTRSPGSARTDRAQIRRLVVIASSIAGTSLAFGAGMYVQRHKPAHASTITSAFQLAQVSPEHGGTAFAGSKHHRMATNSPESDADSPAATLETVYSLVKEHYVDPLPDDRAMSHGAIRSLLSALHDPNAYFVDSTQRSLLENEARGKFAGIGAALNVRPIAVSGYTEHKIEIVSALPGSPAAEAGLKPHDIVTRIDGKWILGSDPFLKVDNLVARLQAEKKDSDTDEVARATDAARRRASNGIGLIRAQMALRGDSSSLKLYNLPTDTLKLTIGTQGSAETRTIDIRPRETDIDAPRVSAPNSAVTVIRISAFGDSTFDTLRRALLAAPPSSAGIVLDLRGNSGGIGNSASALQSAQKIDSLLCPAGQGTASEFAVERLAGNRRQTLRIAALAESKDSTCSVAPILVLVDSGTAEAAEALAAALADAGRAKIIGQQTFGSANVSVVYNLPDGSGFVLSTGQLASPKHVEWAGRGLTPSLVLPPGTDDADALTKAVALLSGNARIAAAPLRK